MHETEFELRVENTEHTVKTVDEMIGCNVIGVVCTDTRLCRASWRLLAQCFGFAAAEWFWLGLIALLSVISRCNRYKKNYTPPAGHFSNYLTNTVEHLAAEHTNVAGE